MTDMDSGAAGAKPVISYAAVAAENAERDLDEMGEYRDAHLKSRNESAVPDVLYDVLCFPEAAIWLITLPFRILGAIFVAASSN